MNVGDTAAGMPLSGIRVIDMGRYVAAPLAGQILGDLGAEVIKVERTGTGDEVRSYGPPFVERQDGSIETSPDHYAVNRNKKSVAIDLKSDKGIGLMRLLAERSDVLLENFKAGHMQRIGLGAEELKRINPGLVYCAISGFGQSGPYSDRGGLDSIFQAMSGVMSLTGEADGPPMKTGTVISDIFCALYSAIGVLSALRHREVNGGGGQAIDMAVLETSIAALIGRSARYFSTGIVTRRFGNKVPGNEPGGVYPCSDGEFMLSAGTDGQFRTLMTLLGHPEMIEDPRFVTRHLRGVNHAELTAWLSDIFRQEPRDHWMKLLVASGLMCAPVNAIDDILEDPHVAHRGMVAEIDQPGVGTVRTVANPIHLSGTPITRYAPVRAVGADTRDVLGGLLGLRDEEIAALRDAGVVSWPGSDML
ncbi:CoA transferase [Rhodobacterales bacterium HKCCE2091]|nr:CoA transferase [Rhodobacterales bacterium HKCCE2091]